jgi:hypothetical protein
MRFFFSRESGVREAIKRQEKRNASSSCWRQGLSLIFFTPCVAENERVIYLEHLFDITKTWQKVDMGLRAWEKTTRFAPWKKC